MEKNFYLSTSLEQLTFFSSTGILFVSEVTTMGLGITQQLGYEVKRRIVLMPELNIHSCP